MANSDQDLKNIISDLLRAGGLAVEQLEERKERTPDLRATYQDESYIIEIKSKLDNEELLRTEEERLASGEMVQHFEGTGRLSPIARVIEDGVKQIRSLPPNHSDFRLLWLHAEGARPKLQMQQFHGTLYGTTNIIEIDGPSTTCYYFYQNELYKFRHDLDGAVLTDGYEGQLCLNNFSPRANGLRESFLARSVFKDGICDPEALEREGRIFIADGEEDRNDSNAVIRFLQKKYGRMKIMNMNMGYFELRSRRPVTGRGGASNPTDQSDS